MIIYTPPSPARFIPVVDLAADDAAQSLHRACRETGFFYIANHGVPTDLITAQLVAAKSLFDLPLEEKMRLHMKQSPRFDPRRSRRT